MGRKNPKIKITGHNDMAEYRRLWAKEYSKDPKRIALVGSAEYKEYMRKYSHEYRRREGYKAKKNKKTRDARAALRIEVINHYSNGALCCCRCGYDDIRALDLDHKADNGGEHRRAIGRRGATYDIYAQLKRNGFPDGFQVLCRNCNWIKEIEKRSQRRCNTLNPSTTKEAVNG